MVRSRDHELIGKLLRRVLLTTSVTKRPKGRPSTKWGRGTLNDKYFLVLIFTQDYGFGSHQVP